MLDFGFYNMDCMDGMRQFPDKYFDLAIVDPPYGDGGVLTDMQTASGSESGLTATSRINRGGVAWETEIPPRADITRSDSERKTRITRTGGTRATKYAKKL